MAGAMEKILKDPELRQRLITAGQATGQAYDMNHIADLYDRYYTTLLNS